MDIKEMEQRLKEVQVEQINMQSVDTRYFELMAMERQLKNDIYNAKLAEPVTEETAPVIKPWSEQEVSYLRKFYNMLTKEQLSDDLERTIGAVYSKAYALNLTSKDNEE